MTPPAAEDSLSPIIDVDHLDRVTFRDRSFRDEVLTLFVREANALAERLAAATTEADWRLAAHTLKGMARGVGAIGLAAAAEQAEQPAPETARPDVLAHLSRLIAEAIGESQRLLAS